jgi:hypothetical protein
MPRKPKIHATDPLDFDHAADARFVVETSDLPGADDLLTPAQLAKRWHVSVDALRKLRERGTGPAFIVMNRRRILYRLFDVVNFEAGKIAHSRDEARVVGLL